MLAAVHPQVLVVDMLTLPEPPTEVTKSDPRVSEYKHAGEGAGGEGAGGVGEGGVGETSDEPFQYLTECLAILRATVSEAVARGHGLLLNLS